MAISASQAPRYSRGARWAAGHVSQWNIWHGEPSRDSDKQQAPGMACIQSLHRFQSTPGGDLMLNLMTGAFKDCSGTTRRQFVQVGGLSMLGLALPDFLRLRQAAAAAGPASRTSISCIFLW